MATAVKEIMTTTDLTTVDPTSNVAEAARMMRDKDIGDVLVTEGERIRGIITDRDITVRVTAEGKDPENVKVIDACSSELVSLDPDDDVSAAAKKMRDHAVRRLPVVEGGRPVGIVSLGDLAVERDPDSALADISADAPNN